MSYVTQRTGTDCVRSSLASILDAEYEALPYFDPHVHYPGTVRPHPVHFWFREQWRAYNELLRPCGLDATCGAGFPEIEGRWLAVMKMPDWRGPDWYNYHCVAMVGDELYWDPDPAAWASPERIWPNRLNVHFNIQVKHYEARS